jgi:hypothetical protein
MIKECSRCEGVISDAEAWVEEYNAWDEMLGTYLCESCHMGMVDQYLETCQE